MDGRVDDAERALQQLAVTTVATQGEPGSLQCAWQLLTRGDWSIEQAFTDEASCYLVLRRQPGQRAALSSVQRVILERLLRGTGQKVLALELGLSCSTVAASAKQALGPLGLRCVPSRAPLPLVVVVRASDPAEQRTVARVAQFEHRGVLHRVVAISRPDRNLDDLLPSAEVEVLRARIEGYSHQKIAGLRRTSRRTVANQLASASRRLGVSGRLEIIGRLSQHPGATCSAS